MVDYKDLIVLSYFKQFGEKYILSDLLSILGIETKRLDRVISCLVNNEFLKYKENYLLEITEMGIQQLEENSMLRYKHGESEYINKKIDSNKAWPLDKPYVPDKFIDKL